MASEVVSADVDVRDGGMAGELLEFGLNAWTPLSQIQLYLKVLNPKLVKLLLDHITVRTITFTENHDFMIPDKKLSHFGWVFTTWT